MKKKFDSKEAAAISQIQKMVIDEKDAVLAAAFEESVDEDLELTKEYKMRLYGRMRGSLQFLRLNQLPLFSIYHEGYFAIGAYEDYRKLFREFHGSVAVSRSIAAFVYAIATEKERTNPAALKNLLLTRGARWWQKRVLQTIWEGKQKEILFGLYLKRALPQGYSIRKPTETEDGTYKMDYFILDADKKVALGVSVKSESYAIAKERGHDFLEFKETYEVLGHEKFKKDFSKPVVVAISSLNNKKLIKQEIEYVLDILINGEPEPVVYEIHSSPANSPWVSMSGDFPELEF